MRRPRIFVPDALASHQDLVLKDPISHRLQHVLRLKVGSELLLFNGEGPQDFPAVISGMGRHQLVATTQAPVAQRTELGVSLHLYQGMIKAKPMDWLIQKATELGVSQITPLHTEFTDHKKDKWRDQKNHDHWRSIIIAASEQCGRGVLPALNPAIDFDVALKGLRADDCHVVGAMQPPYAKLDGVHYQKKAVNIFIGPEGGFNEREYLAFSEVGALPICLSPMILRAETAAVVALGFCQHLAS